MKLFSKRYLGNQSNFSVPLRNRLSREIKYIVVSGFLEPFLTVYRKSTEERWLEGETLKDLSLAELGYDLNEVIHNKRLDFNNTEGITDNNILDLIEVLIIFSKENCRKNVIDRFTTIFKEEGDYFFFNDFLLVPKTKGVFKTFVPFISDENLRHKLEEYLTVVENRDYKVMSRLSADLVQRIFSSPDGQKKTRDESEKTCEKIAERWASAEHIKELKEMLSSLVGIAKKFNNKIANIRHTDKHTIPVKNESLYKLIDFLNFLLAEVTITTLADEYIHEEDAPKLKKTYFEKYKISNSEWEYKEYEGVKIDDLPF